MNAIREIEQINQIELERGIAGTPGSWHAKYSRSAWVYLGNLDHALTEGDIICVLSQYGEIEDIHLVRDEQTGKSKGFCFVKFEDARSCVLAVDNFVGIKLCGRSLRIDHVENYRLPKHLQRQDSADTGNNQSTKTNPAQPGQAYEGKELANQLSLSCGRDLFAAQPTVTVERETFGDNDNHSVDSKKRKKKRKREDDRRDKKRHKKGKVKRKDRDYRKQRYDKQERDT